MFGLLIAYFGKFMCAKKRLSNSRVFRLASFEALKVAKVSAKGGQLLRRPDFLTFFEYFIWFQIFFKVLN